MDFHRTFQGGKDMNLKLENSLVVLSQRKKEQGLPQRPTKNCLLYTSDAADEL